MPPDARSLPMWLPQHCAPGLIEPIDMARTAKADKGGGTSRAAETGALDGHTEAHAGAARECSTSLVATWAPWREALLPPLPSSPTKPRHSSFSCVMKLLSDPASCCDSPKCPSRLCPSPRLSATTAARAMMGITGCVVHEALGVHPFFPIVQ